MSAGAMITSVRNNLNLLSKRDRMKNRLGGFNSDKKTEYDLPKATTKQLKVIAKRIKEERKVRLLKVIGLTLILCIGLVYLFLYSADGITELLTY
ncbi:hypothetical protein [Winogradskyella schleiferi]|uniref:hypothetical protein n=1 Tax=Winogradskyella schleiferi TaxID=2686078 RepID=UPI001E48D228|nr:hypothetical protein [Winogradskyella schleiferi]